VKHTLSAKAAHRAAISRTPQNAVYPLLRSVIRAPPYHHEKSIQDAATDAGSSRNTTSSLCEVLSFWKRSGRSRPRSVSILNKMEPLPSLLYSMITRQRAMTNSYVSVLPILAPRARYCQTFSTLKWVPPSLILPKPQVVAGPVSTRRLHDILHLLVALLIVEIVVTLFLHDILHLLIALLIVEIVVALCLHDIHHLRVALLIVKICLASRVAVDYLGVRVKREGRCQQEIRKTKERAKEKGLRYGGGGWLVEVRIV
jgi:hypothetical protein